MKEYKFRYWDKRNKNMFPVSTLYFNDTYYNASTIREHNNFLEINEQAELMQFTGLRERTANTSDNKEIYEGDIVRVWSGEYCQGYWEFDQVIIIKDMINDCFYIGESEYVQIIGNIFENPEIVEKVEREQNRKSVLNKTILW